MKIKELLNKYNLHTKKRLGQNFLINDHIITNIFNKSDINDGDGVIEIGPGLGTMTKQLLNYKLKVVIIEIDKDLIIPLQEQFINNNVEIINEDFLNIDLEVIVEKFFNKDQKIHIVANLPYYITTPILFKCFESKNLFSSFIFMMQKEVGQRIVSGNNKKNYNNLSVICQFYSQPKIILEVNRNNFFPVPNVDSVVVNFQLHNKYQIDDNEQFTQFVRKLFIYKRKTLFNNLNHIVNDKNQTMLILEQLNLNLLIRSEQLSVQDFINLYKIIKNKI